MLNLKSESFLMYKNDILSYQYDVNEFHQKLHDGVFDMTGWVELPVCISEEELCLILDAAAEIQQKYTALVVIGIGGSYLGSCACYEMLEHQCDGVKLYFAGWNFGSRYHRLLLDKLEKEDVAVCVISKSGTTAETTLAFQLFKRYLQDRYGDDFSDRVYAITDPEKGDLRKEADAFGYHTFPLDSAVGGRYSALTAVGLLPLAAAGIDIRELLAGAKVAYHDFLNDSVEENLCYRYAAFRNVMYQQQKYIEFFTFAEPEMVRFGHWLRQLFAESEGKDGKGIYPTILGYSTDLHSVEQYLVDGTPVFFETMIDVASYDEDLLIPGISHSYNDYNRAVTDAVYHVRNQNETPIIRLTMDALDPQNVGYMIYFFEKACAMSCLLMGVNPFDQPGVESYKKEMKNLLGLN